MRLLGHCPGCFGAVAPTKFATTVETPPVVHGNKYDTMIPDEVVSRAVSFMFDDYPAHAAMNPHSDD
jgi:hypothetical protein